MKTVNTFLLNGIFLSDALHNLHVKLTQCEGKQNVSFNKSIALVYFIASKDYFYLFSVILRSVPLVNSKSLEINYYQTQQH